MKLAVRRSECTLRPVRCKNISHNSKSQHEPSERPDGPFSRSPCRRLAPSVLCKSPVFWTFDKNRQFFDGVEMVILGILCVQNCAFSCKNCINIHFLSFIQDG